MIYLLRHGEIKSGKEKRYIGWSDPVLSDTGIRQAKHWHQKFWGIRFENIVCSDLKRARQTAEIVCKGSVIPIQERPALREINLGELENRSMAAFKKEEPMAWQERGENLVSHRPPGGESFSDLHARVWPEFEKISANTLANTLIVGHAGVNRTILSHLLGMPPGYMFRLGQDYACLNIIDHNKKPYRIIALNLHSTTIPTNT